MEKKKSGFKSEAEKNCVKKLEETHPRILRDGNSGLDVSATSTDDTGTDSLWT